MEQNKIEVGDIERRVVNMSVELRAAEEGKESRTIIGSSAVFDSITTIGRWFREKIDPGFFDPILNDSTKDVTALFNHNPDNILARRSANTLKLWKDENSLKYEFEAPNTTIGNDLLESVKRGDIKGCSFQFSVAKESWEYDDDDPSQDLRTLLLCEELYDVGPVTFPAYKDTSVEVKRTRPVKNERQCSWKRNALDRESELRKLLINTSK